MQSFKKIHLVVMKLNPFFALRFFANGLYMSLFDELFQKVDPYYEIFKIVQEGKAILYQELENLFRHLPIGLTPYQ